MIIFAYDDLLWNPNFNYSDKTTGHIEGYDRRFWVESKNRGSTDFPGRVVTIVKSDNTTHGIGYIVDEDKSDDVLAYLDKKYDNFKRVAVDFHDENEVREAITYVLDEDMLTCDSDNHIVHIIANARGVDGSNYEYLNKLNYTLLSNGIIDSYVDEICDGVMEMVDIDDVHEN